MGYTPWQYRIGTAPEQGGSPTVLVKGDSWIERHVITLPPVGLITSGDSFDNVVVHVRAREEDAEPEMELTSSPPAGVIVSRPAPDTLIVQFEATPAQTAALELTAPDGGRIPGTPAPPETVPGVGGYAMKVYLPGGRMFTAFVNRLALQSALVYGGTVD